WRPSSPPKKSLEPAVSTAEDDRADGVDGRGQPGPALAQALVREKQRPAALFSAATKLGDPMRIANIAGRASLLYDDGAVDVARASNGRFGPQPRSLYDTWDAFQNWATSLYAPQTPPPAPSAPGPPVPRPGQVFAIGFNYRDHAVETDSELPAEPLIFTKFPSCITGPNGVVTLSGDQGDWEVELVVVIGREAHRIEAAEGWSVVAGVAVGQDIS